MKRLTFQCTLLSELIMSSRAANEGFHKSLDYLPGAKFMGLVARKLYDETHHPERSLDLFHTGRVRFGDAHPLTEQGQLTYPVPLSWMRAKKDELAESEGVYVHHFLEKEDREQLVGADIQLKQVRGVYVQLDTKAQSVGVLNVKQRFTIKSAYDRKRYRSADAKMYGYYALPRYSQWQFSVDLDQPFCEEGLDQTLIDALEGTHRMGRSSSAQYGQVNIQCVDRESGVAHPQRNSQGNEAYLYALSNWCFYDEQGQPSLQPTVEQLHLPKGCEIDWHKSQLRTRTYRTWNKKRNARNSDRHVITRGSVLVIKLPEDLDGPLTPDSFAQGVGAHRSEGFGQLLLNPPFLPERQAVEAATNKRWTLSLRERNQRMQKPDQSSEVNAQGTALLDFLNKRKQRKDHVRSVDEWVNDFVKAHTDLYQGAISSSQWGQLRNIAHNVLQQKDLRLLLFDKDAGFLLNGQSKNAWGKGQRIEVLQTAFEATPEDQRISFIKKVATQMAKQA